MTLLSVHEFRYVIGHRKQPLFPKFPALVFRKNKPLFRGEVRKGSAYGGGGTVFSDPSVRKLSLSPHSKISSHSA